MNYQDKTNASNANAAHSIKEMSKGINLINDAKLKTKLKPYLSNSILPKYNSISNDRNTIDIIPPTIDIRDSGKGKRRYFKTTKYKTMNEILKYNEIKSIKSSIYTMTDEDINAIPQEYIDELKDLANLINSILK